MQSPFAPVEHRHGGSIDRRLRVRVGLRSPFVIPELFEPAGAPAPAPAPKEVTIDAEGLVSAEKGIKLHNEPSTGSARGGKIYPQNTPVHILSKSGKAAEAGWIRIQGPDGLTGWIEERYVVRIPANPVIRAVTKLFYVAAPGDKLEPLVVKYYSDYQLKEGDDLRTIVQAISILNQGNDAVYYDDNKSDNAWFRDHIFDRDMAGTRQIYAKIGVKMNRLIYFPSKSYIDYLKDEHRVGQRSDWKNTAIEYGEKVVGFIEGMVGGFIDSAGSEGKSILEGLWSQVKNIFFLHIYDEVKHLYDTLSNLHLTDVGKKAWGLLKEIVGEKIEAIEKDLNKMNARVQYHAIGELYGNILFQVALFVLTDGAGVEGELAARMGKMTQLLKEVPALEKLAREFKPALDAIKTANKVQGAIQALNSIFDAIESIEDMEASATDIIIPKKGDHEMEDLETEGEGFGEVIGETFGGPVMEGGAGTFGGPAMEGGPAMFGGPVMEGDVPALDKVYGDDAEVVIRKWLFDGGPELKAAGLPVLDNWLMGQYNNSRHGIDIIGFKVSNGKMTVAIIEVKGGVKPKYGITKGHGPQMSGDWVANAVDGALANPARVKELQQMFNKYGHGYLSKEEMRVLLMKGERHVIISKKSLSGYMKTIKNVLKKMRGKKVKLTTLEVGEAGYEVAGYEASGHAAGYEAGSYEAEAWMRIDDKQVLSVDKNTHATQQNKQLMGQWGIDVATLLALMVRWVDLTKVRAWLVGWNTAGVSGKYALSAASGKDVDAYFTEVVHQFQLTHFIDPREQDGVLGRSTLETMGFFDHHMKIAVDLSQLGEKYKSVLVKFDGAIQAETKKEFSAANWFDHIVYPAFLGVRIVSGVHKVLWRKLKAAEDWLLSQPAYKNMTAAELGRALGMDKDSYYSGGRFLWSQAMHAFGLAIDVEPGKNPYVGYGAGAAENERLLSALRTASGDNLVGSNMTDWLYRLEKSQGMDSGACYSLIKHQSDRFVQWLGGNPTERAFWQSSITFSHAKAMSGFLNLHRDLVVALRQQVGLAWGAMDFKGGSGDMMHFDYRTIGFGRKIAAEIGGAVPDKGTHPAID